MNKSRSAVDMDFIVGAKIRQRREELRISQKELADAIGLTFQQIQKYERATNRISAGKLFEVAQALDIPVGYFFQQPEGVAEDLYDPISSFLNTRHGAKIMRCSLALSESELAPVAALLAALADTRLSDAQHA